MWQATDAERIRTALNLPPTAGVLDAIAIAMDWLTQHSSLTITTIQAKLNKLDALEATLDGIYGDSNFALVRADVLEWQPGNKAAGPEQARSRLIEDIRTALNLGHLDNCSSSWGNGRLYRS